MAFPALAPTDPRLPELPAISRHWVEASFYSLIFLVTIGPLLNPKTEVLTGDGNPFRQLSYLLVFMVLAAATARAGLLLKALATSMPVNVLLGWCWASLTWALNPGVAMRRLALTTLVIYSVFIAVRALGVERVLRCMRISFVTILMLNFAVVLMFPTWGIHQFAINGDPGLVGNWRGFFPEKNLTGSMCAITLMLLVFDRKPKSNLIHLGLIVATAFFLVRTGSKTSMGITCLSLFAGWMYARHDHRNWPVVLPAFALLFVSICLLVHIQWDVIVSPLDRQDAFTGRTQIWLSLLAYVQDHWMLGAGYGSFWNIGPASPIYDYAKSGAWFTKITSGHNGYLDLATQIGFPGLLIAVFALIVHPFARLIVDPGLRHHGSLAISLLLFCAGQNFTESTMLDRDLGIQFCLMLTIAIICSSHRKRLGMPASAIPAPS